MPERRPKSSEKSATAFHGEMPDGTGVVGVGNIRVVIVKDEDQWFAQGLEIDYAAQGVSVEDAQKEFEEGFYATIHEHLRVYGSIERILKVAPSEVWRNMLFGSGKRFIFSQVSLHEPAQKVLPFTGIGFYAEQKAA